MAKMTSKEFERRRTDSQGMYVFHGMVRDFYVESGKVPYLEIGVNIKGEIGIDATGLSIPSGAVQRGAKATLISKEGQNEFGDWVPDQISLQVGKRRPACYTRQE
jgi:hypothetical protein